MELCGKFCCGNFSKLISAADWYSYAITMPTEVTAAAIVISYWDSNSNLVAAWISIFLAAIVIINFCGV